MMLFTENVRVQKKGDRRTTGLITVLGEWENGNGVTWLMKMNDQKNMDLTVPTLLAVPYQKDVDNGISNEAFDPANHQS